MPVLQNDPGIQVRFVGVRLRNFLVRYETASRGERLRPIEWAEWSAFIDAAYSCGFVCNDGAEGMGDREKTLVPEFIRRLEGDLGTIQNLCLCNLRRILHYIMRSECWSDGDAGTGGGAVWMLIMSRLGNAIARRLGG
jgi:hypothetical protein